jgi:hypothetical protein
MDAHQSPNVPFLRALTGRMREQQMEARISSFTEHRRLDAAEVGMSGVLASLCGVADLDWSRFSDFS